MASPAPTLPVNENAAAVERIDGRTRPLLVWLVDSTLHYLRCYRIALIAYALFVPYLIAIIAIIALLDPTGLSIAPDWLASRVWYPENPLITGVVGGLLIWLIVSLFLTRVASAWVANWHSYSDLRAHLEMLGAVHPVLCTGTGSDSARVTCATVGAHMEHVKQGLREPGLHWFTGHGYIHYWQILQRAEDDLIAVEPMDDVIRRALVARLRLIGSDIPNSERLVKHLDAAIVALCPSMAPMLEEYEYVELVRSSDSSRSVSLPDPSATALPVSLGMTVAGSLPHHMQSFRSINRPATGTTVADSAIPLPSSDPMGLTEAMARESIRVVQRAIREYRDSQWGGLLEVRNRVLMTTFATEVGALALLGLAVVASVPDQQEAVAAGIVGASTFFLIGGVVGGLYSRLRSAMEAESAVTDYGLSTARLFATPLFSGLAAVGGVILTEAITQLAQPTTQAIGVGQMFQLTPMHLVMAALFGLVPARFFDRLGQAEDKVANLRNTEPLGQGKVAIPPGGTMNATRTAGEGLR